MHETLEPQDAGSGDAGPPRAPDRPQGVADAGPPSAAGEDLAAAGPEAPPAAEKPRGGSAGAALDTDEVARLLAASFPALFSRGAPRPLKLRIQADIQQRAPGAFSRKALSAFLHRHTTSSAYLKALVAAETRFDLDGAPAGEIAPEHREAAVAELARRRAIVQARRAAGGGRPGPDATTLRGAGGARSEPSRQGHGDLRRERAQRGEQAEGSEGASQAARAGPSDQAGPSGRPGRSGTSGQAGRSDMSGQAGRSDMSGHAGQARQSGPSGQPRQAGRDEQGRRAERLRSAPGRQPPPRPMPGDRDPRATAPRQAPADAPLPADEGQRERAMLLRAWEASPLAKANFCALKRLSEADFDARIAQALSERAARG